MSMSQRSIAAYTTRRPYDSTPREQVDQLHAMALELGGSDEGAPGERGSDFYWWLLSRLRRQ